jgi:glycosyltransferase involved in cell wall biosynthesis
MTRVAVVIPCFDDGATLGEAVDSLAGEEPHELVVVDDGTTDERTLRILEEREVAGVRVLRQENAGLSAARMAGVRATSARYVFPLDADDLLVPGRSSPGATSRSSATSRDGSPGRAASTPGS